MNGKPTFARPTSLWLPVTAALATFIAIGLLTAIVFLFQRDGAPMKQLAAAERACAQRVYVSEREACMREWLAAARSNAPVGERHHVSPAWRFTRRRASPSG